ncbi:SIS domain-containing protein [Candidatus Bipolaricaulota bacterium]|nr:SIS domain-containing protein [Candidatus Bipolaricaulota bacterium]
MSKGAETKREIKQQPEIWKETLERLREISSELVERFHHLDYEKLVFFGSGTSYYLAQTAASTFRHFTGLETEAAPSSEILLFPETYLSADDKRKTICCSFSRSGKTSETVKATKFVNNNFNLPVYGFTCYEKSPLAEATEFTVKFPEAKEESVVMTKSFTSMLIGVIQAASALETEHTIDSLPQLGNGLLGNYFKLAKKIFNSHIYDRFVFLGGGPLYGIASESMLKLKEMALETTEVFHPLEYRHGPKSTADKETLVTLYLSDSGCEQEVKLIPELKELEASVVTIGEGLSESVEKNSDYTVELSTNLGEFARTPLYLPFAQILGLQLALNKDLDPDSPKNLTQVVELAED